MFPRNVSQRELDVKVVHFGEVLTAIGWLESHAVFMLWFEVALWKLNHFIYVERDWTWPDLALRGHNEGVSSEECPLRSDIATHNLHLYEVRNNEQFCGCLKDAVTEEVSDRNLKLEAVIL